MVFHSNKDMRRTVMYNYITEYETELDKKGRHWYPIQLAACSCGSTTKMIRRYFNNDRVSYNILMDKTAIIDIDNTLWQFCDAFYEELRNINVNFPTPENWTNWEIWDGYCTEQDFYNAVNAIHLNQDSDKFQPYPEAKGFLSALKQNDFHITIASHRSPDYMSQTARWLKKHGLVYDDIHLSYNKTSIIHNGTYVVVDDSPQVLEKAVESGAFATGLLFPWNRAYRDNGFKLCSNLDEILDGILKR